MKIEKHQLIRLDIVTAKPQLKMPVGKAVPSCRMTGKTGHTLSIKPLTQTARFGRAVQRSIDDTQKKGNPVARYDIQRRQPYLEYPDGTKVYVD